MISEVNFTNINRVYEFREENGVVYTYAKINGFYGWYQLVPVEITEQDVFEVEFTAQ